MPRFHSPLILLAVAVLSYGFSNALVRHFAAEHSAPELAFWLALATISGLLASFGRHGRSKMRLDNPRAALPFIILQASAFMTFVLAMDNAPAALVGAILPIEGIVAASLAALFLGVRLGWVEVLCIAGCGVGAVMLAGASVTGAEESLMGLLFALASASLYGVAMLAVRRAALSNAISGLTFWSCVPIAILCAPFGIPAFGVDMLYLFSISCIVKTIADLSYTGGIARAPITLASSTLPMIGIATTGFAWLIAGEAPGAMAVFAAIVIAICYMVLIFQQGSRRADARAQG
jgi:drug/metabolite transporter (DMT)-like permease